MSIYIKLLAVLNIILLILCGFLITNVNSKESTNQSFDDNLIARVVELERNIKTLSIQNAKFQETAQALTITKKSITEGVSILNEDNQGTVDTPPSDVLLETTILPPGEFTKKKPRDPELEKQQQQEATRYSTVMKRLKSVGQGINKNKPSHEIRKNKIEPAIDSTTDS